MCGGVRENDNGGGGVVVWTSVRASEVWAAASPSDRLRECVGVFFLLQSRQDLLHVLPQVLDRHLPHQVRVALRREVVDNLTAVGEQRSVVPAGTARKSARGRERRGRSVCCSVLALRWKEETVDPHRQTQRATRGLAGPIGDKKAALVFCRHGLSSVVGGRRGAGILA